MRFVNLPAGVLAARMRSRHPADFAGISLAIYESVGVYS